MRRRAISRGNRRRYFFHLAREVKASHAYLDGRDGITVMRHTILRKVTRTIWSADAHRGSHRCVLAFCRCAAPEPQPCSDE